MAGYISAAQQRRDLNKRNVCPACGHDGTTSDPLVRITDGYRVHQSHTTDKRSGFYGQQQGA